MGNRMNQEILVRLSRREVIRCSLMGAAGLILSDGLSRQALADAWPQQGAGSKSKAKSVIQIWLWGGPSHLDTFDPKPAAGQDYTGQFGSPNKTNVDGMLINELMPELAKQADKYSLIRSMTHGNNGHETASYIVQTGFNSGDDIVHPGLGAVVSHFRGRGAGYSGLIPPYIVLTQLLGRFSEAGFLGSSGQPFATGGDPNQARFLVEGVVAEGVTDQRQRNRKDLLRKLDALRAARGDDPALKAMEQCEAEAYDLILGDAGKIFDLTQEKDELRTQYGRTTFGQSCLLARRLVEKGVPFVAINNGGWDSHKQNFPTMRRKLPELDRGLATLLQDLSSHGLLDSTIVWCGGEFGRTPRVQWEQPWDGGRGHWGQVFSCLLAGGGFKGGQVVGASDAKGEEVRDLPVYPPDLMASILELMGIDPKGTLMHPRGMAVPIVPSSWGSGKSAGRLKEIM
jgi:hypothetical protein